MKRRITHKHLNDLYRKVSSLEITDKDRVVIFSDLHMGNGGRRDDFLKNSELFQYILQNYYLKKRYKLILNGDVEELHRFSLKSIMNRWEKVYQIFNRFSKKTALYKIVGNHDCKLYFIKPFIPTAGLLEAMKLIYKGSTLFIFHGHQSARFLYHFNNIMGFFLRYIATPLYIKNTSVSFNSSRRFKIEKNAYNFSLHKKIISIIGHTHRPLFESLSKIDSLRFKIEQLCRKFYTANEKSKENIKKAVKNYKQELLYYYNKKNKEEGERSSLYTSNLIVPSLFNSGCVIGKTGITAIEIDRGNMMLTHWFDKKKHDKYLHYRQPRPEQLNKSSYYKLIFNRDPLSYIFTRINLLT
ncbi:MAG: metallophosphoesterase [Spirochaetes bacterium]|nr:metallophosphoesterase [Spirochaetota bacterium]